MDSRNERGSRGWWGLLVFLAVAFGLSWPVQIALALGTSAWGSAIGPVSLFVAAFALMWPPAIGAYLARRVERSGFEDAGLRWPPGPYILIAWFGPAGLTFLSTMVGLAVYPLDVELSTFRALLARAGQPLPVSAEMLLLAQVAAALTVAVPLNSLFAFGEEFGWRGYLLPRLMARFGSWPGLWMHGAIWGLWHAPLVVLASYNYPGHPVPNGLGALEFTVFCVLLGAAFAWLRLASGSILPPTIAHGALNAIGGLPLLLLRGADAAVAGPLWSPVGWGVLGLAVALLFAIRHPIP